MERRRCLCKCHEGSVTDRQRADGVSLFDPVEAATACSQCRPFHSVALLNRLDANAPVIDPNAWTDPPRLAGEGDE